MKIMLEGNTVDELYADLQAAKAIIEATMGGAEFEGVPVDTPVPVPTQPATANGSGQPPAPASAAHGFNPPVEKPGRAKRRNKATIEWDEANNVKMAERKKIDAWKHANAGMPDETALALVRGTYGPVQPVQQGQPVPPSAAYAASAPPLVAAPPVPAQPVPAQPVPAQPVPAQPTPQTATGDPYMGLGQQVQQPQAFPVNPPPMLPMPGQQPQAAPALQTPMQAQPQPQLPPTDGVTLPPAPTVNPAGHAPAAHANPPAGAPVTDDMMRAALHNLQTAVGVPYAIQLMNKYGVTDVAQFPVELRPQIVAEIDAQVRAVE